MKPTLIVLALAMSAASLGAQQRGGRAPEPPPASADPRPNPQPQGGDSFARCLFPPELVMMHQRDIGLQDAQRTKLIAEMSQAQAKFTEVQWMVSAEQLKLEQLLKATAVDETAALKQVDRILALEQDLKRTQMTLMVRIKNTLTPQQQSVLLALRPRPFRPDAPLYVVDGVVQGQPGGAGQPMRQGPPPVDCG